MMKMKKGMIFLKFIDTKYDVEYRTISFKSADEEHKIFYKFLLNNCIKDEEDITKKDFKYLFNTYSNIKKQIELKTYESEFNLKVYRLCRENQEKYVKFLKKTSLEYKKFDSLEKSRKEYNYYNNLASWYSLKIDMEDKILNNLYKISMSKFCKGNDSKIFSIDLVDTQDETQDSIVLVMNGG